MCSTGVGDQVLSVLLRPTHDAPNIKIGKYVIDDHTYHRNVKPDIIKKFQAQYSNFKSLCGSNPDFFVERDGTVYPGSKKMQQCTKV